MQRVMIIGCAGVGKSTLARKLAEQLQLPLYHLDRLFWRPGWQPTPRPEWVKLQQELVAGERWLIDGNYDSTLDVRLARADTVVFMDLPRWRSLWGVTKRFFQYRGRSRPDLDPGCPEKVDWEFYRWIWGFPKRDRPGMVAKLKALPPEVRVIWLRSHRAVDAFLASVKGPNQQ